jgi:hypothetical protein
MTATIEYYVLMTSMLVSAVGNLIMIGLGWRKYRRAQHLCFVLGTLCVHAFASQHLPIWVPWSRAFGYRFSMTIEGTDDDKRDRKKAP